MSANNLLPSGFEALEPFAAEWAIETLPGRVAKRGQTSPQARAAFYAVASDLLEAALDYLDTKPIAAYDAREQRLMLLMQSLAHIAMAEEVLREDEPKHTRFRSFMPITRVHPASK